MTETERHDIRSHKTGYDLDVKTNMWTGNIDATSVYNNFVLLLV